MPGGLRGSAAGPLVRERRPRRLVHDHARELRHARREQLPDALRDPLTGRQHARKRLDLDVEIPMVERTDDELIDRGVERAQIRDRAEPRIERAADGHLEAIVMPVWLWIGALAVEAAVLLVRPRRVGQAMRR